MIEAILSLTETDLHAVALALRSGRLLPPFTTVGVRHCCLAVDPGAVAAEMQVLADEGMRPEHLALLLETVAQGRQRTKEVRDSIELVWTGPEPPGTASRDTIVVVPELFASARESVLVVGYAVYQGRVIFRRLAERMEELQGLRVRMFLNVARSHGDTSAESEILQRFGQDFKAFQWPGSRLPEVYYDPRALALEHRERAALHAKCIVMDRSVSFISSANFTTAAQIRNIEVGVLIRSIDFAGRLADHFSGLVKAGIVKQVPGL